MARYEGTLSGDTVIGRRYVHHDKRVCHGVGHSWTIRAGGAVHDAIRTGQNRGYASLPLVHNAISKNRETLLRVSNKCTNGENREVKTSI